ncbi:YopX family protein [Paenibacillus sp. BAC0078]
MRDIEFRGKRIDNGEWVYGSYQVGKEGQPHVISWWFVHQHEGDVSDCVDVAEVIPETVGQYTGFKDKNDKKIFDGDILHWNRGFDMYSAVEYQDGSFWSGETLLADSLEEVVVGNIHDNADLIAEV